MQWGRGLLSFNKSTGRRWSPIPKPPPQGVDRLCGTHSVLNTLRAFYLSPQRRHPHRRQLYSLYVRDFRLEAGNIIDSGGKCDVDGQGDSQCVWVPRQYQNVQRIVRLARALNVNVNPVERRELVRLCGERRNQNVVLEVASFIPKEVVASPWKNGRGAGTSGGEVATINGAAADDVVFLDHVIDPANVGAIMRIAFFMGLRRVVLSSDSAGCTAAVCRASAGFMEYMSVYRSVVPTLTFLENTTAQYEARGGGGVLEVYATSALPRRSTAPMGGTKDLSASSVAACNLRHRLILLGNEGLGLSSDVMQFCTHVAHIPCASECSGFTPAHVRGAQSARHNVGELSGVSHDAVDDIAFMRREEISLNVSAASALILAALRSGEGTVDVSPNF